VNNRQFIQFTACFDPYECLVQDCPIGRWQSASITNAKREMQNAKNLGRTTVQSVDARALPVTNARNLGRTTFLILPQEACYMHLARGIVQSPP
jgi:hypothetical protein